MALFGAGFFAIYYYYYSIVRYRRRSIPDLDVDSRPGCASLATLEEFEERTVTTVKSRRMGSMGRR